MPYRAAAAVILELWREAERKRVAAVAPADIALLDAQMEELRLRYAEVVAAAIKAHAAEPDNWPEVARED